MMEETILNHEDYISRGFEIIGKIPITRSDPAEGIRVLRDWMRRTSPDKVEFVPGSRVPEALTDAEANDSKTKYFVVYEKKK